MRVIQCWDGIIQDLGAALYVCVHTYVFIFCLYELHLQGRPYPEQEQNAIDIIMQFAIHRLKFKPENIILFGWSIGGYTSTWAAMNYPEVRGLVIM